MILFLDIENTVIDNLTNCNWLEKNCEQIKKFIFNHSINRVHIYTWGWKTNKEINQEILNNIYNTKNRLVAALLKKRLLIFVSMVDGFPQTKKNEL